MPVFFAIPTQKPPRRIFLTAMNDYRLRVFAPVCLLLCAAAAAIAAAPAPASFSVGGAVASPQAWTPAALTQRFAGQATTLAYTLKGARHTSRAVPLEAILEAAQPKPIRASSTPFCKGR